MRLPRLNSIPASRQVLEVFGGLNQNLRVGDGEWSDMDNMSLQHYPVISPRRPGYEGKIPSDKYTKILGAVSNNGLCLVMQRKEKENDIGVFVLPNGKEVPSLTLDTKDKTLVSMGAYVIVLPDKIWVNVAAGLIFNGDDIDAKRELFAKMDVAWDVSTINGAWDPEEEPEYKPSVTHGLSACDAEGNDLVIHRVRPESDIPNGYLWADLEQNPPMLLKWYESLRMWREEQPYVKLRIPRKEDDNGNELLIPVYTGDALTAEEYWQNMNGFCWIKKDPIVQKAVRTEADMTKKEKDNGEVPYIVLPGMFVSPDSKEGDMIGLSGLYEVKRTMPEMDFVIESGNRMWGCKYGKTENGFVNEIYASKLGDPINWHCYAGVATDSYFVQIGDDGEFTGAVNYLGRPVFFKENRVIEIYGAYPAQYRVQSVAADGVKKGCSGSAVAVNNVLYYLSPNGVCAYDGSMPKIVSYALGQTVLSNAMAAANASKYYLQATEGDDRKVLYIYDAAKGLWLRQGPYPYDRLLSVPGTVLSIGNAGDVMGIYSVEPVDSLQGKLDEFANLELPELEAEGPVSWLVESGDIGLNLPDSKYLSRLTVRMSLGENSQVTIYVKYDFEEEWIHLTTIPQTTLRSFDIPIRPKRCDTMRLRIEGIGDAKIYSLTKTVEQGGTMR